MSEKKFVPYIPEDRKIEHKMEVLGTVLKPLTDQLNEQAEQGWMAIGIWRYGDDRDPRYYTVVFRRELRLEPNDDI